MPNPLSPGTLFALPRFDCFFLKEYLMRSLNIVDWICLVVLIIGGINWGLVGFFNFNLVENIVGVNGARFIYGLVGICALYVAVMSPNFGRKPYHRTQHTAHQPT
jgi:uncharacterized membrane protein YuzA (DUF378 family)